MRLVLSAFLATAALLFSRAALADNNCGDLAIAPKELTFAKREDTFGGASVSAKWRTVVPYDRDDAVVELTKVSGDRKATVTICKKVGNTESFIQSFELDDSTPVGRAVPHPLTGLAGAQVIVHVTGPISTKSVTYKVRVKRPTQGTLLPVTPHPASSPVIAGIADYHDHGMAHLAFGGNYTWGDPGLPLTNCGGFGHAQIGTVGLQLDVWPFNMDTTEGVHILRGKTPEDWPHYADPSHQTMHFDHMKQAYAGGLRLIVLYAVNSAIVCALSSGKTQPCDDMDSARVQLYAIHAYAARNPWFRIVRDPWEARKAIADGKLAVVLGVEVPGILADKHGDWREQLDEIYDLDVRAFEVAMETDSDFAGAALHHVGTMKLAQLLQSLTGVDSDPYIKMELLMERAVRDGTPSMSAVMNPVGLKQRGRELLPEMARRHMLIPLDHISRAARDDVFAFVKSDLSYYPLHASHSRFDTLIDHTDPKMHKKMGEYMLTDANVDMILQTGGVFGLRTGDDAIKTAPGAPSNTCGGSSRSMAQMVHFGNAKGVHLGFGTDADGFVDLVSPRFPGGRSRPDNKAAPCPSGGTPDDLNASSSHPMHTDFDTKGLAHLGLLPDLASDMGPGHLGEVTTSLHVAAETYLKMWERTYDRRTGRMDPAEYKAWGTITLTPSAIPTTLPAH